MTPSRGIIAADRTPPRVVSFDAGDTLFTERAGRSVLYAEVFAAAGADVEPSRLARWMDETQVALGDAVDGHPRYSVPWFRAFVGALLRRADCDADAETVRCRLADVFLRASTYVVFDDVVPSLDALARHGVRLAVLSNWSDRLPALLADLGLARWFEFVVVSQVVGHHKPDARIFAALARESGCPAASILHVGDRRVEDLEGARRAGFAARLLDRNGDERDEPAAIRTLGELVPLVAGR